MKRSYLILIFTVIAASAQAEDLTLKKRVLKDVKVIRHDAVWITIKHTTGVERIPFSELPEDWQKRYMYDPATAAAAVKQAKEEAVKKQADAVKEGQTKTLKENYDAIVDWLARYESGEFIGEDATWASRVVPSAREFKAGYEKGDEIATASAWRDAETHYDSMLQGKPVFGYEYNELLKRELATPIDLYVYNNVRTFCLRIGDGQFSSATSMNDADVVDLRSALLKCQEWSRQCRIQKFSVRKEIQATDRIALAFVSQDSGATRYVQLHAIGGGSESSLMDKSSVRLNMLNVQCLAYRLGRANLLLDDWDQSHGNARRLK